MDKGDKPCQYILTLMGNSASHFKKEHEGPNVFLMPK